jgi:hypothetical protein
MNPRAIELASAVMAKNVTYLNVDKASYAVTTDVGTSRAVTLAIDPAVASALYEIAKSILVQAGAKALASWFGLENNKGVQEALRALLTEIADVIRSAWDEKSVQDSTDDLRALTMLMREYTTSPESGRFRLEAAIVQSAMIVERLESRMPIAANAYILGCLTRIAALQELSKLGTDAQEEAEKSNYKQFAKDKVPKLTEALGLLIEQNRRRVTPLVVEARVETRIDWSGLPIDLQAGIDGPGDREPKSKFAVAIARYYADGVERVFRHEERGTDVEPVKRRVESQATAAHLQDSERVEADFMSKVGLSLRESVSQMVKISEMT